MARKIINFPPPWKRLQRLPFKLVSRSLLAGITGVVIVFISWMMYHIFFQTLKAQPLVSEQRTELLQPTKVGDLELYKKNSDVPPSPSSIFPISDISLIP